VVIVYGLLPKAGQARFAAPPALTGIQAIQAIYKRSGGQYGVLGNPAGDPRQLEGGVWSQDFTSRLPIHGFTVVSVHPNPAAMTMSCSHPPAPSAYTTVESSVYWSQQTGAHIVSGEIRQFWLKQGGPRGPLGLPTSDEMPSRDGSGRISHFEHGDITWHYDKGATVTRGNEGKPT